MCEGSRGGPPPALGEADTGWAGPGGSAISILFWLQEGLLYPLSTVAAGSLREAVL